MSASAETIAHVITAIGQVLGPLGRTARPDSNLRADLAMDDIHLLSLAQELDETHGTEIADTEVESWRTVPDVANTLSADLALRTGEVA